MKSLLDRALTIFEIYVRGSLGGKLIATGLALLTLAIGLNFNVNFAVKPAEGTQLNGSISSADTPEIVNYLLIFSGLAFIVVGLFFTWQTYQQQQRKLHFALEIRGLSNGFDTPLTSGIPRRLPGARKHHLIDVREMLKGGPAQLKQAVDEVNFIPRILRQTKSGLDREDLSIYVGGIAPTPLLFLAGSFVTSEGKFTTLDWERLKKKEWVSLSNGVSIPAADVSYPTSIVGDEALLVVALSYSVNKSELDNSFPDLQRWELGTDALPLGKPLSEESLEELTDQFMNTIVAMKRAGINVIHLVLATPSSVAIRLGSAYSHRNMPKLIAYQYQKDNKNSQYPWGVEMPNSERDSGVFVNNETIYNEQILL